MPYFHICSRSWQCGNVEMEQDFTELRPNIDRPVFVERSQSIFIFAAHFCDPAPLPNISQS